MEQPILTIIVPCYNEEEILPLTFAEMEEFLGNLILEEEVSEQSKILFVDDGSTDRTWELIYKKSIQSPVVRGLKLACNAGHQNALLAGMEAACLHSDCVVTIDADLQDDIQAIRKFIRKYRQGYEVVYGVRKRRETDTFFKRATAEGFYKLMHKLGVDLVYNHAHFRLLGKRARMQLQQYQEANLFLRGIVPLIGFRSAAVYYDRKARVAGTSKYPLGKMIAFGWDGVTSFSVTPIRFVLLLGIISFFISLSCGVYFVLLKQLGHTERGWTSMMVSVWLMGGLQLIAMGLVGEYIGKIYKETKRRPKFIVDIDLMNLARQEQQTRPGRQRGLLSIADDQPDSN